MGVLRFFRWLRLELTNRNRHGKRLLAPFSKVSPFRNALSPRRIFLIRKSLGLGNRYLEIGVQRGFTLEAISGERVGVDPYPRFDYSELPKGVTFYKTTSRDFFSASSEKDFDLIFLDGLHTAEETYGDFVNSLRLVSLNGAILIDDVLPSDEPSSIPDPSDSREQKRQAGITHDRWYGDVWRLAYLIMYGPIASAFETFLIGKGAAEQDHSQLLVLMKSVGSAGILMSDRDLAFMESLDFDECVHRGENSLLMSASVEEKALERLSVLSLRHLEDF